MKNFEIFSKMTVTRQQAAAIVAAILIKRKKQQQVRKRLWTRRFLNRREFDEVSKKLMEDLRNDSYTFHEFFRMSPTEFDFLLNNVRDIIAKRDTNMRKSVSAEIRLAITIRFLSSGDSYRSLMLAFRVAHNTISKIVPEVCKAIYTVLNEQFLKVIEHTLLFLNISLIIFEKNVNRRQKQKESGSTLMILKKMELPELHRGTRRKACNNEVPKKLLFHELQLQTYI